MSETHTRWEVRSEELRRNLRPLLNSIEREGAHVTVKRYDERAAVIVPAAWYDAVLDYIGATTFTTEAAAFYARQSEAGNPVFAALGGAVIDAEVKKSGEQQ